MRISMLAVICLFTATLPLRADATDADEQAIKLALGRLQGRWLLKTLEQDGETIDDAGAGQRTFFFGGERFLVKQNNIIVQAGRFKINPQKEPKTINAVVLAGQDKDAIMLGIYSLEGKTLKICLDTEGQDRPSEFTTKDDSHRVLAVYERPETAVDEKPDIAGDYASESIQSNGAVLRGEATIARHGEAYQVTYKHGGRVAFVGAGIRKGDVLSVCWTNGRQPGLSVYTIEPGPKLIGEYTQLGGLGIVAKESLLPKGDAPGGVKKSNKRLAIRR